MKKILVTGAGTGFGKFYSLELARRGHEVYAAVELPSQIYPLREEAEKNNLKLNVIKIDITDPIDHKYAQKLDIDILVNNAGIGEGGSIVDMPDEIFRRQFEVNVFSPLQFTKLFLKKFTDQKKGRIVFISSVAAYISAEYTGAYTASKHALDNIAETLQLELKPFGVTVSTINPAPYKTGFNDVQLEACYNWYDKETAIINHDNLSFPMPQYDQFQDINVMVDVILDDHANVRNVFPKEFEKQIKDMQAKAWIESN
ncbi:SDR family oxidoreductase [Acinetobacter baumannii]|uniref:SDR family oxidoreductase n=1 Tax=Acinetobacter baumannii TaxID=470 RepID=UPI0023415BDF|nr:SDR family oxidoreductase [Acinetobacter baumannii]MDC5047868.1 SDR family oxidoreductase [Acinetobacter baumannii]MDH2622504.1 SDR family oxidoreductase [Acinetobacter baumannii]